MDDGPAAALSARVVDSRGDRTLVELVIGEGRNREIRRMCDALGRQVLRLVRTAVGPITDRDLKAGEWRELETGEVARLYQAGRSG